MGMENVYQEPATVSQDFWVQIVPEVRALGSVQKPEGHMSLRDGESGKMEGDWLSPSLGDAGVPQLQWGTSYSASVSAPSSCLSRALQR